MNAVLFERKIAIACAALCLGLLGGCATTGEAANAQLDANKADQSAVQAKQAADSAQSKADRAMQAADRAQSTANQAASKADSASRTANNAISEVARLEQKIDRMFKKTMRK